jgi:hypothetical protein
VQQNHRQIVDFGARPNKPLTGQNNKPACMEQRDLNMYLPISERKKMEEQQQLAQKENEQLRSWAEYLEDININK